MKKIKCALIGPGNIGTDLLAKLQRSHGLKRARAMGIKTTADGVDGLLPHVEADRVQIAFDATSAYVHAENSRKLNALGVMMIDLTPAGRRDMVGGQEDMIEDTALTLSKARSAPARKAA